MEENKYETFSLDQSINDLYGWLKERNFENIETSPLKLILSENKTEGRCVISTKNVEPNTNLIQVPVNLLINHRLTFKNKDFLDFFSYCHQNRTKESYRITRLDALYLFLIAEKLDENSNMHKFINTMPVSYDTPEYFDDELITCLPDYLRDDIQLRLSKLNHRFASILQHLKRFQASCDTENKTIKILVDFFNFDLFRWAFCSVNSRCFHIKEKEILNQDEMEMSNKLFGKLNAIKDSSLKYCESLNEFRKQYEANDEIRNNLCCLIPFLDFMNHSFSPNSFAHFDMEKKLFIIKSQLRDDENSNEPFNEKSYPIKENNQVYITYGYHENKTLFIEYGFILNENAYDKLLFKYEDFAELLQNNEYLNVMWRKAIEDQLLTDFSCNNTAGPSWFLLKMFDLINFINNLNNLPTHKEEEQIESPKKKSKSNLNQKIYLIKSYNYSDESLNFEQIKPLFNNLLNKYEQMLDLSLTKLDHFRSACNQKNYYHVDMSIEFCKLQLEIVNYNIKLSNDSDRWKEIF